MIDRTGRPEARPRLSGSTSLAETFRDHPERQYVMFGGKGGLGKTTFSAATAWWLAQQGKKVLVFSVDPQASLSDIFQQDIFGKGPVKIVDNLWAQEIDADRHIKEYQDEIRQKILDMYGLDEVPAGDRGLHPGRPRPSRPWRSRRSSTRSSTSSNQGDYDYYIYDLVPLGHALYYLSMAKVYDEWIGKITQLREEMREYEEVAARMKRQKEVDEDEILGELQYIRNRINSASRILTDRSKTAFFFVVIPEQMILIDTKKAAELFAQVRRPDRRLRRQPGDPRGARASNRCPPTCATGSRCRQGELERDPPDARSARSSGYVPELERDVTGLPMIERVAGLLYG